jgi:hypothetical protein
MHTFFRKKRSVILAFALLINSSAFAMLPPGWIEFCYEHDLVYYNCDNGSYIIIHGGC